MESVQVMGMKRRGASYVPPSRTKGLFGYSLVGLDRIIMDGGYIPGLQVVLKLRFTPEEELVSLLSAKSMVGVSM